MKSAYAPEVFPQFWNKMDEGVSSGLIFSSKMVLEEVSKQDDDVFAWAKARDDMFHKLDQLTLNTAAEITRNFPKLINTSQEKDMADPFLIALAKVKDAVLVTQETPLRNSPKRMKIPDVCEAMSVQCINILGMVKALGWRFG